MYEKYTRLKFEVENLKSKLEEFIEDPPKDGFEERIMLKNFERLFEVLQDTIVDLNHFSKKTREGILRKMGNGKYELIADGVYEKVFSCGSLIECFVKIDDEMTWAAGRVEYTSTNEQKGYYFYNREAGHPFLYDGMKARIRASE